MTHKHSSSSFHPHTHLVTNSAHVVTMSGTWQEAEGTVTWDFLKKELFSGVWAKKGNKQGCRAQELAVVEIHYERVRETWSCGNREELCDVNCGPGWTRPELQPAGWEREEIPLLPSPPAS